MSLSDSFQLTFAGVPFVADQAKVVRLNLNLGQTSSDPDNLPPRTQQPLVDLVDELNRLIPFRYLSDFNPPSIYPGKNLAGLGVVEHRNPNANDLRVGDYYYPFGATRWSVFRGLATSHMVKDMLAATQAGGGNVGATFVMANQPVGAINPGGPQAYRISTSLYMLPPRPLGELGGSFAGLYLVTLVDERYTLFQGTTASLTVMQDTTWADLITDLADALGIVIDPFVVDPVYSQPEPDSQLWTSQQNAAVLLDAVAANLGRVVVRGLDGTYSLQSPQDSYSIALLNRGVVQRVVRTAGGEIFASGRMLPVGDLTPAKNTVIPSFYNITYPGYVYGDDPVPHLVNTRYQNQRPSTWNEDSYGGVLTVTVPITSGPVITRPVLSGGLANVVIQGAGDQFIHDTAKALYPSEAVLDQPPINASGLTALAMQMARDAWERQLLIALDEVYPGTLAWVPEGTHDIIWTYSARQRQATTRVLRVEWNSQPTEMQHAAPPLANTTITPRGVGGHSVAQTWRDSMSGGVYVTPPETELDNDLDATSVIVDLARVDYLPTQNRWRGVINSGQVDQEVALFNGTSGQLSVSIAYRGIDGSIAQPHLANAVVSQILPNTTYGANLVSFEKGQFVYPGVWTSGGVQEVVVVPQTQTVRVFSDVPQIINNRALYSGAVNLFDPSSIVNNNQYEQLELVWISERNEGVPTSGNYYDGQLVGYSAEEPAPIYLINTGADDIGPEPGPSRCPPAVITVEQMRCVNGIIQIWGRTISDVFINGCLTKVFGSWFFIRTEGCCACPASATSSGVSSSSSSPGSGPPCIPGVCVYCLDPPYEWVVFAEGFTGTCEVFNRSWVLTWEAPCVWSTFLVILGETVLVTLIVGPGTIEIEFTFGPPANPIATAFYSGPLNDCCTPVRLMTASQCDCGIGAGGNNACHDICAVTPETWTVDLKGFGGCLSIYNLGEVVLTGPQVITSPPPTACVWEATIGDIQIQFTMEQSFFANLTLRTISLGPLGPSVDYPWDGPNLPLPIDCCTARELIVNGPFCPDGSIPTYPSTLTITPNCSTTAGRCPAITAVPHCCGGGSVPSGSTPSSSSSSSSSSGGILVNCCSLPVDATLTTTLLGTGGCVCLDLNTFSIVYEVASDWWIGTYDTSCDGGIGIDNTITLAVWCNGTSWFFRFLCAPGSEATVRAEMKTIFAAVTSSSCPPAFELDMTAPVQKSCCNGAGMIDIVVTT